MLQKATFIFNGTMLTHIQFCEDGYESEEYRKDVGNFKMSRVMEIKDFIII